MSNILQFVKIFVSAESDQSSLYPQECLQMFPKKQQNLMRSQVQTLRKRSECGPSAKWTTIFVYYGKKFTPLVTMASAKQLLSKLCYNPSKYFNFIFWCIWQLFLLPTSHKKKTNDRPEDTRASVHQCSIYALHDKDDNTKVSSFPLKQTCKVC